VRSVSVAALAELTKELGTEPLLIVGIEWTTNSVTYYADKDLPGVKSKILNIGTLESVVVNNRTSQSVEITLDDTDSEIKTIIDSHNIHKINCFVYQYYGALTDLDDKFLLFQGQISTPFNWSEKSRSITFSIVSEIESYEVGFSPEEGQLPFVNDEFVGKAWPLCFGNVVYAPAQKVSQAVEGRLLDTLCVVDELLYWKRDQLAQQYWEQAFLATFYTLVANGAEGLAPPASQLLSKYVTIIKNERSVMSSILDLTDQMESANTKIRSGTDVINQKNRLTTLEEELEDTATNSNQTQIQKQSTEQQISLADYKYRTQKEAFQRIADCYTQMQSIYDDYVKTQTEICNENQCVINSVRIENGINFPQNQDIDLYINNVKFRGKVVDDVFSYNNPPTAKYENIEIASWTRDDDPCAPNDDSNGLNLFWLQDNPPKNLTGLYLLVKKKGEDSNQRHFLKVERQVGRKVYFTLVPWSDRSQSQPQGLSIDNIIGQLDTTPFVPNPWGQGTVPIDLFNGNWDTSQWNTPEGQQILQIINQIPGGVNQQELAFIARLVYLQPWDAASGFGVDSPGPRDAFTIIGEDIESVQEASGLIHKHWIQDYLIPFEEIPDSLFWQGEAGTTVRTEDKDCSIYIANIVPSVIKAVHAYRTLDNGSRILASVPSSYYIKNEMAALGTMTATAITFPFDLKSIPGEGWEDDIYVTLQSSVGPNVCDVIQWLIETYTNATVNSANFATVKAKFKSGANELYPVGFCLLERPNVLEEIERIAFEARCAIYRVGNEFFLKYLSEEPTTDVTFTEDDIWNGPTGSEEGNINLSFPETENLITRMVAIWRPNYLPLEQGHKPYRIILRNNVKLYGMHSTEIDFHIYNIRDLVYKSATFWMIRKSNTWKHVQFQTFLTNIQLESFDTILLNFAKQYISNTAIKGVLQTVNYDPETHLLSFDIELPIRAGEMSQYPFYWPAALAADKAFPTPFEIESGFAGGFGPGSGVQGTIDDC